MSRFINSEGMKRADLPLLVPATIIVKHEENTRLYKPDVSDLVEGFETVGQLQPCVVRPIPGGFVQLVAGYRRWQAAMQVSEKQRKAGVPEQDRFRLACIVQKIGPDDALIANIEENAGREALSPIESAVAIQRLRNQRNWRDTEGTQKIAKIFKRSAAWVAKTEELLSLSEDERFAVHQHHVTNGKEGISQSVAEILAKVPEDRRAKALKEAQDASMKGKENIPSPSSTKSKSEKTASAGVRVRDMAEAASRNGAVIAKARPVQELYELIDGYKETMALHPLHFLTEELLKHIRGFMARTSDDRQFDVVLMRIDGLAHAYYDTYSKERHPPRGAVNKLPAPKNNSAPARA